MEEFVVGTIDQFVGLRVETLKGWRGIRFHAIEVV